MIKTVTSWVILMYANVSIGQTNELEKIIGRLDQKNTEIVAKADTAALMKLLAPDRELKGQIIRRRFTHVCIKQDGAWRLLARHANNVCAN
jgi:hypothetical protein